MRASLIPPSPTALIFIRLISRAPSHREGASLSRCSERQIMKIGYLFPVAIIIAAVVLLAWFILGGYALPQR
ncbi:YoaK family small membrane protein [Serratia rubidaea]